MNYTMGRYIDELDDEGRDRLIAATDFSDGEWWNGECGCLVYTGEGATSWEEAEQASYAKGMRCRAKWADDGPPYRYPYAVLRFGKARVVRAIKLRAAKGNTEAIAKLLAPAEHVTA